MPNRTLGPRAEAQLLDDQENTDNLSPNEIVQIHIVHDGSETSDIIPPPLPPGDIVPAKHAMPNTVTPKKQGKKGGDKTTKDAHAPGHRDNN